MPTSHRSLSTHAALSRAPGPEAGSQTTEYALIMVVAAIKLWHNLASPAPN
jgi:hypothetical protein